MKYALLNIMNKTFLWLKNNMRALSAAVAVSAAMIAPCSADSYATLARAGDTIILEKGETALIQAASGVIAYRPVGKQCAFLRFSQDRDRTTTVRETFANPLPLVGPAKITIRSTDGYCGMRIVYTGLRNAEKRALITSAPPVKSPKRK